MKIFSDQDRPTMWRGRRGTPVLPQATKVAAAKGTKSHRLGPPGTRPSPFGDSGSVRVRAGGLGAFRRRGFNRRPIELAALLLILLILLVFLGAGCVHRQAADPTSNAGKSGDPASESGEAA